MAKQSFIDTLLNLYTTNHSALYSSADITDKTLFMSTPVPTNKVVSKDCISDTKFCLMILETNFFH